MLTSFESTFGKHWFSLLYSIFYMYFCFAFRGCNINYSIFIALLNIKLVGNWLITTMTNVKIFYSKNIR